MSFKDRKRDDRGHVIGNDEVDGQKCQHTTGGDSVKGVTQKDGKSFKVDSEKRPLNDAGEVVDESLDFDADYEEEFNEPSPEDDRAEKIANDIGEYFNEAQINELKKYCDRFDVDFDRAKIELAKRFDKMQKDAGYNGADAADAALEVLTDDIVMGDLDNDNEMANAELENAIKSADDDVLDEQFGKDTAERKLAGAVKGSVKEDDLGKIQSKNNPQLTGEKILHEGWKRNIPQDKIAIAISKELGVSLEDAKEYVEKESKLPEAIDFDEWIENSNKSQPMKAPINRVSMSGLPKHHKDNQGRLVIDEGPYAGIYTNEREFWNDVNASNPQIIYKEWNKMTPEEQKTTKAQAKNVFDDLNDKYYNDNIENKPAKEHINLLKKFISNENLSDEEFENVIGILERYVK